MPTNRYILTDSFLCWSDTQIRRLKRYADAGKQFLCGIDGHLYCKSGMG